MLVPYPAASELRVRDKVDANAFAASIYVDGQYTNIRRLALDDNFFPLNTQNILGVTLKKNLEYDEKHRALGRASLYFLWY